MVAFEDLDKQNCSIKDPEKISLKESLVVKSSKLSSGKNALKLLYFRKLLNFVRVLSLYIIIKNDVKTILENWNTEKGNHGNDRILNSLVDMLVHFNIIKYVEGKYVMVRRFEQILNREKLNIVALFENEKEIKSYPKARIFGDFLFVKDLIKRYRDNIYSLKQIKKNQDKWIEMIQEGMLDYEIRLAETLYELSKLRLPGKIKSPFDEDYYTESGRNAFKNFTQYKFIDFFTKIVEQREKINVLDIGCGYGNYLDVLNTNYPMFHISGIESQEKVFKNTSEKFKGAENVEIIHGDFFKYPFKKKFDIILLNYVLFYFDLEKKSELLAKAKDLLAEGGSIIVCQYFSNIENFKKDLAQKQGELSLSKKIEMFFSNKVLYANTLWNDTADTFSESVKWEEFLQIVLDNKLQVNRVTNADKFYYSLFIELTPSN